MSVYGINCIGSSFSANLIPSRNHTTNTLRSISNVKSPRTITCDHTSLSRAGSSALQKAYADSAVVQMAFDSARAVMEKMRFITSLLENIEKDGYDTAWVEDFFDRLRGDIEKQFGGEIIEEKSFLETLLEELKDKGPDTSWVTNLIELLDNQIAQSFGTISKSIFIKKKNAPLTPLVEASVLSNGMDYKEINSTKFNLDLNTTDKHDVKSAADSFIKKLEERMNQLENYTQEVHSDFESVAQEIFGEASSMSPEMATQVASVVGLQIQQNNSNLTDIHGNLSAFRALALIK